MHIIRALTERQAVLKNLQKTFYKNFIKLVCILNFCKMILSWRCSIFDQMVRGIILKNYYLRSPSNLNFEWKLNYFLRKTTTDILSSGSYLCLFHTCPGQGSTDRTLTSEILEKADQGGPRTKEIFKTRTGRTADPWSGLHRKWPIANSWASWDLTFKKIGTTDAVVITF